MTETLQRAANALQLSRAHVSAEIHLRRDYVQRILVTSIEPRSRERGNLASVPVLLPAERLQLSRAHVSAEMLPPVAMLSSPPPLQLSRAHVSAEICSK